MDSDFTRRVVGILDTALDQSTHEREKDSRIQARENAGVLRQLRCRASILGRRRQSGCANYYQLPVRQAAEFLLPGFTLIVIRTASLLEKIHSY